MQGMIAVKSNCIQTYDFVVEPH